MKPMQCNETKMYEKIKKDMKKRKLQRHEHNKKKLRKRIV